MVGTNHKHAPIAVRERLWCPPGKLPDRLKSTLRKLGDIPSREKTIVDLLTRRIVNKLLYEPTVRLKEHASNGDSEDFEAMIRELFSIGRQSEE